MFTAARARTPAAGEARAHLPSPAPRKRRPGRSQAPRKGLRHGSVPVGFKPGSPPREAGRAAAPRRSRGHAGRGRLPGKVGFVARLLGQGVCDLLVKGREAVNEENTLRIVICRILSLGLPTYTCSHYERGNQSSVSDTSNRRLGIKKQVLCGGILDRVLALGKKRLEKSAFHTASRAFVRDSLFQRLCKK
uniref:Uncharacterized protein n=1 Tax=Rousettus aegyptiacus TaxID=9407 RepID=A0A7J8C263_ROUAE|nr:hypothetical protein HJG63_009274 [Rousettus aegyptiacus]